MITNTIILIIIRESHFILRALNIHPAIIGFALLSVLDVVQDMLDEKGIGKEFIDQFDLNAGTSVGGCSSLILSMMKTT